MNKIKKIAWIAFFLTLACALMYVTVNIASTFFYFTSFPWWSAFVFAAYYFGPVLILEFVVYLVADLIEKKKK